MPGPGEGVILTVLNDNRGAPGLLNEWGWSVLVEPLDGRPPLLFDADTSPRVLEHNAPRLSVDMSRVWLSVLSHEHYDHYGGYPYVARARPGLPVYAPPGLHQWAKGLNLELRINKAGGPIGPGYTLTRPLRAGPALMEHSLIVDIGGRRSIVIVGCSHPGVDRIVEEAVRATGLRPELVIGGYHGPSARQLDRLLDMAEHVSPAHCSGEEAVRYVRETSPEKLVVVRTGSRLLVTPGRVEVLRF